MYILKKILNPKNLDGENKTMNNIRNFEMLVAILFLILGIVMLINPFISNNVLKVIFGILVLLECGISLFSKIKFNYVSLFKTNIIYSAMLLLIAVCFFFNIFKFLEFLPIYFGSYLILKSIKNIILAFNLKSYKEDYFVIVLVTAIMHLAMGVIVILFPFESFAGLEKIAIFSILVGLLNFNTSYLLREKIVELMSKVDNY